MADRKSPDATKPTAAASDRGAPNGRSVLQRLQTGVPGLDAVLGGGLPEFSFNMLAGGPGVGKTTLAQQMLFANATKERPAIYFTLLGEPTVKMLRYQRQFSFFKPELVGSTVHYVNLSEELLSGNLAAVLARMTTEVERLTPAMVAVDSFRTVRPVSTDALPGSSASAAKQTMELEQFVQQLALHLTTWEVTSLLIGEYAEQDQRQPLFTIADGIFWLTQATDGNSVVRKLQALKIRGQAQMPGLHTFRITGDGVQVFPRIPEQQSNRKKHHSTGAEVRLSSGVPGLDALMGGGVPAGDALVLAGPTGTGKSTFGMLFAAEGLKRGESVVAAVFEEYPEAYLARLRAFDVDPDAMIAANKLRITYLRPLDLSVDETLADILASVQDTGATRVVIDSLTGLEVALAPTFREAFRESLYRLVGALTATEVTVFMILEQVAMSPDVGFTGERVSFITDNILVQRYVEMNGVLEKVLAVVKMRRSRHSPEFRRYEITATGAAVGEPLVGYHGILTGMPERRPVTRGVSRAGLTRQEAAVLNALVRLGEAPLAELASSGGVPEAEVASMVERLVALGYAVRVSKKDVAGMWYRAVARGSGP